MSETRDQFTATLSQLRMREVMDRRPGRLVVSVKDANGERQAQLQGSRITVGSHPDNSLVLQGDGVSGVHFELVLREGGAVLRDLRSKNGTWLAPHARVFKAWIEPGSRVFVGRCELEFLAVEEVEVPVSTMGSFGALQGRGTKMGELFSKLERLASLALDVLVTGETGTGKELVARGLHEHSSRASGPFVVVDCTTLNQGIAESILFGHRKGAFTGAASDQPGLLEQADGGTLFIDEVGELPTVIQPKLLRALQERQTRRVGETKYRSFDARIVAATNRDLASMVGDGSFREDLFFRLGDITLELPALRDRGKADIHALANVFLEEFSGDANGRKRFAREAYERLSQYRWPGNVRELRSAIRYAAVWGEGEEVGADDLPTLSIPEGEGVKSSPAGRPSAHVAELEVALLRPFSEAKTEFERIYVERVLAETGGNQSEAARRVEMSRSAFRDLLKRAK